MCAEKRPPAVSIVVPVFNTALYLRECLESILSQSFINFELICVNDGSTDECAEILSEFEKKDNRIKVITQANQGLSAARNRGAEHARGKYIIFIDSDDWIDEDTLTLLFRKMESEQLEVCCFNAIAFGEDEASKDRAEVMNRDYFCRELDDNNVKNGMELLNELIKTNNYIATAVTMILLRSYYLQLNISFFPGIIHEDEPWTFNVLFNANRTGCLNKILYHYRMRYASITSSKNSFRDAYGYHVGTNFILGIIGTRRELYNSEKYSGIVSYPLVLQNSAINSFRQCALEEKKERFSLDEAEFVDFERSVVFSEVIQDRLIRIEQDLEKERNTKQSIISKNREYITQLNKTQLQLSEIMSSHAYRIGRKITWIPGKLKWIISNRSIWNNKKDNA